MARRQVWWFIAALIAVLLVYALIDGGEEQVRPIVVPVQIAEPAS